MRVNLDSEECGLCLGFNQADLDGIFFLENESVVGVLPYNRNTLRVAPNFDRKLALSIILQKLVEAKEELLKYAGVLEDNTADKIAKIKRVMEQTGLGLKEAKDLVDQGGLPEQLNCWLLPSEEVYVEDRGVFPLEVIQQNKHLNINWKGEVSLNEITPVEFYLFTCGDVDGVAPKAIYGYSRYGDYKQDSFEVNEEYFPNDDKLIGVYSSIEEAKSHYQVFLLGVEKSTQKWKTMFTEKLESYEPKFY